MKELGAEYGISERRACKVLQFHRSVCLYETVHDEQEPLRLRIREIAQAKVRYGYPRIHVMLQREGWQINRKRVYRLYVAEGLSLRYKRPKRHVSSVHRELRESVTKLNEVWGMDFVSDELFNGRRIRALPIIDLYSRECLALYAAHNIRGDDVVAILDSIAKSRGLPKMLRCDNGPEFISKVLDKWAYQNGIKLDFSRRGKPTDNAFVESFNGRLRDECLNAHHFGTLEDAREKLSDWRQEYNERRLHSALNYQTPSAFAAAMRILENEQTNETPNFLL